MLSPFCSQVPAFFLTTLLLISNVFLWAMKVLGFV